ncbi:AaceriACR091Wp [[Ashbya] aceris (nom. inval.)]|nr:AaceriACR091Wp [[Ashbya] aceris (nom. inval.)]
MPNLHLVRSLKLHCDRCWSVDVSKGLLATGSADRKIKLVDVRNFKLVEELDDTAHKKAVRSVAWRPHSNVLAAGSFDTTVSIWGRDDDDYNGETELLAVIEGHENEVKSVAWSHNGVYLATCSRDKSVWIWEADDLGEEFECTSVLQEHAQDVKHITWHANRLLLASSSYDDTVRVWAEQDDDWECAAVLTGHGGTVWCSDFERAETGIRLCSGSDDTTVRVWRCLTDDAGVFDKEWIQETVLPAVHTRAVYSVSWSVDGLIASVGSDGVLAVYKEVQTGRWEVIARVDCSHTVYEVNIVKWLELDGRVLLVTGGDDGCVNVWELKED